MINRRTEEKKTKTNPLLINSYRLIKSKNPLLSVVSLNSCFLKDTPPFFSPSPRCFCSSTWALHSLSCTAARRVFFPPSLHKIPTTKKTRTNQRGLKQIKVEEELCISRRRQFPPFLALKLFTANFLLLFSLCSCPRSIPKQEHTTTPPLHPWQQSAFVFDISVAAFSLYI